MSDLFKIVGSWGTTPQTGSLLGSGAASELAPICESVVLALKNGQDTYVLGVDTPVPVAFGGVTNANVIVIFSNRKITLRLTSADGALQAVPCDGLLVLISKTVPYTAIDMTRVAAQETSVRVFIGEKS